MTEERAYIIEVNELETRLHDLASACQKLKQVVSEDTAELWVNIDHGFRRRNFLERLFGVSDRRIEICFWLAKAGDVAAITFLDGAESEYNATDLDYPTRPTAEQRMALSRGELTPAPVEVCLQADRAIRAAIEYLESGQRPGWLVYRCVG